MVKLFKNKTTFSAKDYIEQKRNRQIYCDLGNTNEGRHLGQTYDNGKVKSTVNQSSLLNLTKGYYDYNQKKLKIQSEIINTTYSWKTRSLEWKNFLNEARKSKR